MKQSSKSNRFSETAREGLKRANERRKEMKANAPKCRFCESRALAILNAGGYGYHATCYSNR